MKKLTTFFLSLVVFTLSMGTAFAQHPPLGGGDGSQEYPYLIETPVHLNALRTFVNTGTNGAQTVGKYYKVVNDLDLIGYTSGEGWVPIGSNAGNNSFRGNFDGNGKIVRNLKIDRWAQFQGLFGYALGASFKNLGVEDCDISGFQNAAGLVASLVESNMDGCYVTGTISAPGSGGNGGGLVGVANNSATISNCYTNVHITGGQRLGGLAGTIFSATIANCYSLGTINSTAYYIGGLVGYHQGGIIKNSVAANESVIQDHFQPLYFARVAGYLNGGILQNNYGNSDIDMSYNGTETPYEPTSDLNGRDGMDITIAELKTQAFYTNASNWLGEVWNFTDVWYIKEGQTFPLLRWQWEEEETTTYIITATAGANGTIDPSGEVEVEEGEDQAFSFTPAAAYKIDQVTVDGAPVTISGNTYTFTNVTANHTIHVTFTTIHPPLGGGDGSEEYPYLIETVEHLVALRTFVHIVGNGPLTSGKYYKVMNDLDLIDHTSGAGWAPIGFQGTTTSFQGFFDGNGKIVRNLKINSTQNHVGLFGYTSGASIKNLGVEDCDIVTTNQYAGAIVGSLFGNPGMSGCYVKGGSISSQFAGGLAGQASGSSITDCYTEISVRGTMRAGGLLGQSATSTITRCYALGKASASSFYPGGLLGLLQSGTLSNSVAANDSVISVGGATMLARVAFTGGTFLNNYGNSEMVILHSNTTPYEVTSDLNGKDGMDVTIAELKTQAFYTTASNWNGAVWDFENVWKINEGESFPLLQWQEDEEGTTTYTITATTGANGTIEPSGAVIVEEGENQAFSFTPASAYKIDQVMVDGAPVTISGNTYTFTNVTANHTIHVTFTTIHPPLGGGDGSEAHPYLIETPEHLDALRVFVHIVGNGPLTSGKYYKVMNDLDLINYTSGQGWIPIGLQGSTSSFQGNFDGNGKVVRNLKINTTQAHTGLFGYIMGGSIKNLGVEDCNIVTTGQYAGGLVGSLFANSQIFGCYVNGGSVNAQFTGGLAGQASGSTITDCYTATSVRGTLRAGGLLGTSATTTITRCYALGKAHATSFYPAGLVGVWQSGTLSNSVAANDSVISAGGATMLSRVAFLSGGTLQNNYGNSDMLILHSNTIPYVPTSNLNGNDGMDISIAELKTQAFYTNAANWNATAWDFENVWYIKEGTTFPMFQWQRSPIQQYTIAASANPTEGGNVTGAGIYDEDETVTLTATPNEIYHFVNWTEEGTEVYISTPYVFTAESDRTLVANFELKTYTVTYNAPANGTLSVMNGTTPVPSGTQVTHGTVLTITATPNANYHLETLTVNGSDFTNGEDYTVTSATTIAATFAINPSIIYTITATAGANGTIAPSGEVEVEEGEDQQFTFTPATIAYVIDEVTVDGAPVSISGNTYTFTNITANHTIHVTFKTQHPLLGGGDGSEADPYLIETPEHLDALRIFVHVVGNGPLSSGKYYKVMNDLDLIDYTSGVGWIPIGRQGTTTSFQGNFDGNGKVVHNLKINTTQDHTGLFGYTMGATIKNLGVEDCDVVTTAQYAGGLAGSLFGTQVSGCYVKGGRVNAQFTGGLAGQASGSTITDCYTAISVRGTLRAGGLLGVSATSTITRCYALGKAHATSFYPAGLVGILQSGSLTNSVAANDSVISGGGATMLSRVAFLSGGMLQNNYGSNEMVILYSNTTPYIPTSNLNGNDGMNITIAELKTHAFYTTPSNWNNAAWDFENVWKINEGESFPLLKWQQMGPFVSVTDITDVPDPATATLPLTGTVIPSNATNTTIVWSVGNAGTTGATISGTNIINVINPGSVTLLATIVDGTASGNFTKQFTIMVNKATLSGTASISGDVSFGKTLTAVTTSLTSSPVIPALGAFSYQWRRETTDIPGATASTYTLVQADIGQTINVQITAANCTGTVTSSNTAPVTKATPTAPEAPTMLSNTATSITLNTIIGCEYNINGGAWQSTTTFSGLNPNTSYAFTARLVETATHFVSPASTVANISTDQATLSGTITIIGNAVFGEILTINTSDLTSDPVSDLGELTCQWKRNDVFTGTTNPVYILSLADIGATITVTVTASNCIGSITSAATGIVTKASQVAPDAPTLLSATLTNITLNIIADCEYRMDDGAWQTSNIFNDLIPYTEYTFVARKAETATHHASDPGPPAKFSTGLGIHEGEFEKVTVYSYQSSVYIKNESNMALKSVEIYDVIGRRQKTEDVKQNGDNIWEINIAHFTTGIYFVRITTENGIQTQKIIKN